MCSHYNPTDRSQSPHHVGVGEKWNDEDRDMMMAAIAGMPTPVVHYKVFAGGNNPVPPVFEFLAGVVRPQDVVLVGFHTKDNHALIREDVALFEQHVDRA